MLALGITFVVEPWEGLFLAARRHFSHVQTCTQTYAHRHACKHAHTPLFVLCSDDPSLTLTYGCRDFKISSVLQDRHNSLFTVGGLYFFFFKD